MIDPDKFIGQLASNRYCFQRTSVTLLLRWARKKSERARG